MQRERVQDQYPWTWEIPLAVVCAIVALGVGVCQLGRSFANWFAGAGWRWPTAEKLVTSLPGVNPCPNAVLQQAAAVYGVSVDTLRRRIASGKLRASRFGVRLIRVRVEDLDRLFRPIPTGDDLTDRRARVRNQRTW